jgi:hypothetical protein
MLSGRSFTFRITSSVPVIDGINDDGAVEQTGSDHLFAFAVLLDFFKPLHGFLAELVDPLGGPLGKLRVVLGLPCPPGGA